MSLEPLNNLLTKVNALDDILECPVCCERLSENIPLCTQGHHVCRKCLSKINQCPLCNSKFNGTRNYLAESIIVKFDEIKNALKKLSNKNLHCTEIIEIASPVIVEEKFPCGVYNCNQNLSYNDMIKHISSDHKDAFEKVGVIKSYRYYDSMWIVHEPGTSFEEIYHIENMGIFFLKICISNKGNVYGYVQNIKSSNEAHQFYYKIKIDRPYDYDLYFDGPVTSTSILHQKGQYLDIEDALYEDYDDDEYLFDINVIISRVY